MNPASAPWENASAWSLGIRPASNQTVAITNGGYKAVGISSATVAGFPDSLTVGNLFISAPTGGLSTLLLNYFGTGVPLQVVDRLEIGTNGRLQNLYSSLQVNSSNASSFLVADGGQMVQEGGLTVVTPSLQLQNGTLSATNATMNLGPLWLGNNSPGMVNQSGGVILSARVNISGGTYALTGNGILYALGGTFLDQWGGKFIQSSGSNYGDVSISAGGYEMSSGLVQGNVLASGLDGGFVQDGGNVRFGSVQIQGGAGYQLNNGAFYCGTLSITTNGAFNQSGGTCMLTNALELQGDLAIVQPRYFVTLSQGGGYFSAPALTVGTNAQIHQGGGQLQVNDFILAGGNLFLGGSGIVTSVNTGVGALSTLIQSGGTNQVTGVLSITGTYRLEGGRLLVNGIYLRGYFPIYWSGLLVNSGLINFGGRLDVSTSQDSLGSLGLGENGNLGLADGVVVRFADSSALNWNTNALLVIDNWGWGGRQHVYFGTSSAGLTVSQLSRIRFFTPHYLPEGYYPARMLSTGEVVPAPVLASTRSAQQIILQWADGYQLLAATNVQGPYLPVSGAASPYTEDLRTTPQRFFMLSDQ